MECLHDLANIQQTSSILPANVQQFTEYICWKFAGRLLDRVNTLLLNTHQLALSIILSMASQIDD